MLRGTLEYQGGQVGAHKFVEHLESYLSFLNNPLSSMRLGRRCNAEIGKNARNREILTDGLTIKPTLPSDSQSRVRMTLLLFFLQFCRFHTCTIQEQSRGKSFLERFLKKMYFSPTGKLVVIQILVSCIDFLIF